MGGMSDWAIEIAEENYEREQAAWIRKELRDPNADEDTDGWEKAAARFNYLYELREQQLEDEYEWYNSQEYSRFHIEFARSVEDTKEILRSIFDPAITHTIFKMSYVHSVTALETYLGDVLKYAVLRDKKFIANAVKNLHQISERKFKLEDIIGHDDFASKIVFEQLNQYLYHDVVKVMEYYKLTLDFRMTYNLKNLVNITTTRHDLVHRNGKDNTGNPVILDADVVDEAIAEIEEFVRRLDKELRAVIPL